MADRRTITRRSFLIGGAATLVGAGTASWWAADRFLIPHVQVDVSQAEAATAGIAGSHGATWPTSPPFRETRAAPGAPGERRRSPSQSIRTPRRWRG